MRARDRKKPHSAGRGDLDALLHPRAIAVVGASADERTIPGMVFSNLCASGFSGPILPINRNHREVQGVHAYPNLAACPVAPDLAIMCVPALAAPSAIDEAGAAGVRAACVISAGFAETGEVGAGLEARLVSAAHNRGVRLVGPNCAGVLGGRGRLRFNATFATVVPPPGTAALVAQSGAAGLAILDAAGARGLGFRAFVSIGNSADVSTNDLVACFADDPECDLILVYIESIDDPAEFLRVARRAAARTPIVVIKAGRGEAGRRAAASHTAAFTSRDDAVDAILDQAGVVRVDSIEEMVDCAIVFGCQRRFRGRRVAILTNGGGPGILAADACEANDLRVPPLGEATRTALASILPREASVVNPVDMIAGATAEQYGRALRLIGSDPNVDVVVTVFNMPLLTSSLEVARAVAAARRDVAENVAIVGVFMNRDGPPACLEEAGVAGFVFPERATRALAAAIAWDERRHRTRRAARTPDADWETARSVLTRLASADADGWLTWRASTRVLGATGIPFARGHIVANEAEAEAAFADLAGPTVVKAAAAFHKSDLGAVRIDVTSPEAAAAAIRDIRGALAAVAHRDAGVEFIVQEQLSGGVEMIVGARRDQSLGPLVAVGFGGQLVELVGDVAMRLAPLDDDDVDEMLASLRAARLLDGYRGSPPLDVEALRDVVRRVAALATMAPELTEIDLNPVFVLPHGAVVADVRVRVDRSPGPSREGEPRRASRADERFAGTA